VISHAFPSTFHLQPSAYLPSQTTIFQKYFKSTNLQRIATFIAKIVSAVTQGIKKIKVEPVTSIPVDPNDVFDSIEAVRKAGTLGARVTSAAIYYEASLSRPGLLDRVNASTGERKTGLFRNGEFKVFKP
jgi:hypothetical protein